MKDTTTKTIWNVSGGVAAILVVTVIAIAANLLAANLRLRADLTEEKLYSLSDGTREILKGLDRRVTLKLFFNRSHAQVPVFLKSYATQVEDLLAEYRLASGGNLTIELYDPQPDSDAEEWARRYGLQGQPLGMGGPTLYFGLVAVAGENEAALPALDPRTQDLLEYNITRLIYRIANPAKPVVGVLSSLPVLGRPQPPYPMPNMPPPQPAWVAFRELQADYDLREIDPTEDTIDAELDALLLIHPKDLSDQTLYAIDQYIVGGGKVMVFVDPFSIADAESQNAMPFGRPQTASDLGSLFEAWGVKYAPTDVTGDLRAATRVQGAGGQIEDSFVWLSLQRGNMNRDDVLTSQLGSLLLPLAGSFVDETAETLTLTPLATTSEAAGTVSAMSAQLGGEALRRDFRSGGARLPLIARLSGVFKTAFPDGPPVPEDPEADAPAPAPDADHRTEGRSAVILVADVDMLFDRYCVQEVNFFGMSGHQPFNDNINFLGNAVEQLSGSEALIGIRSRGTFERPFQRVLDLEEKARAEWQTRENELVARLRQAQQQLRETEEQQSAGQQFILSPKQREAIERFRAEELRIERELKDVRKNLRRDIERLGTRVKVINIALMPLLVSLAGIGYGLTRKRR